jgi:hypothetical protein
VWLPHVGLCSVCHHGLVQESARGSTFWRCQRAESEPAYLKYPPLPVRTCPGFEPASGSAPPAAGRR